VSTIGKIRQLIRIH